MYRTDIRRVLAAPCSKSAVVFGLGFLALFVQAAQAQGPLNYFKNYFVTGDYVVGGVGLTSNAVRVIGNTPTTVATTSSITLNSVPCTSGPGLLASVIPCSSKGAVPADVIAAFLYWQTVESTTTPSSGYGSFDATFPSNPFVGLALGNPTIAACGAAGGTSAKYMHAYRADVLKYLPINNTADVRMANGTQTFTLASGDPTTQFVGATLVVVYRLVAPGNPRIAPLRSVVIYDGAFTGTPSAGLNQTMGGFYQAAVTPAAHMTQIVGNGQKGFAETLTVNGGIPVGVPSDPLVGAQGKNWDNYTYNINLAPNASSVQTQVLLNKDCLSWAAIITSTNVQDTDYDGLLDVWETSGLNLNPGVRNDGTTTPPVAATFGTCAAPNAATCLNLPAMGASPLVPDIFMQIDWMQGTYGGSHVHSPQLGALNMVGDAFKAHGINLHFDVGGSSPYQTTPASHYIIPAKYAQGGNAVDESGNLLCPNPATTKAGTACAFPTQSNEYSVLGWKSGFDAIKNGDSVLGLPQLFATDRKDTFHYALFGHGIAATTPLSIEESPVSCAQNNTCLAGSISGVGDLPGGDLMVTLGLWRSDIAAVDQVGTQLEQAGTLMHELGHNLDLHHGGWNNTPVCMPNYPSVMNYLYQVNGLTDAQGNEHLDYAYGLELPMSEDFLSSAIPMGIQQYRVRYFGPFNSATNTPGQKAQVYCNGQLLSGSEGPYVLLQGSTVSTPDWSNGTVLPLGKIITSGLDINYDGITGETFIDQPDWYSLNLQQVGARPNANGLSSNVGISDIGISDIGISDIGISDIGISDIGISDIGISDIGISDIGTSQLGQDALGDQDYASFVLSGGLKPPSGLTAAVTPATSTTGGTGNLLNWTGNTGVATQYNIYRCNATGTCVFALLASVTSTSGTPPAVITTYTDSVNNFVQAGSTCPANNTCYNTLYNYYVTEVNAIAGLSSETGASNTQSSDVTHLTVVANSQTLTYGATNPTPTYTVYSNVAAATSLAGVTCAYSPSPSSNANGYYDAGNYPITCTGPTVVTGTTEGVTYYAAASPSLIYPTSLGGTVAGITQGSLTINPLPITVTATYSTKVYNATLAAGTISSSSLTTAIPTITTNSLVRGDTAAFTENYDNPNVGSTHVMTPAGSVNDNNGGKNYKVTPVTSAATSVITPAPLTASIIGPPSRPYNGNTTATLAPANFSLSGLQGNSDNFTVTQTAGTYNSQNVATATTVTATLAAGNFTPLGGTLATNYTLPTTASGPGTITAVSLTASIVGNPTKPYNGNTTATLNSGNFSLSPLVGTDSFTVTQTVGAYNSANVATAATVTATLTSGNFTPAGTTLASNYTLPTTASGAGNITAVTLTASIVNNPTMPYNGTTAATLTPANFSLSPLVSPDSFTVTQTVGAYNSPNATSATTVTASLAPANFTPVGATVTTNYVLPTTASGAGQIVAAGTTTSINSVTPAPTDPGVAVTVTVIVTPVAPGAGTPTGSVTVNSSPAGVSCTIASFSAPTGNCMLTFAAAGPESITATYASNSSNFTGSGPSGAIPLTVNPPLSLTAAFLPATDQNASYQQTLLASGGVPVAGTGYYWAVTSGALPTGLSLGTAGTVGAISGSPTASPGQYTFGVTVTDALGAIASQAYSITVDAPPSLTGGTLPNALVGTPYNYNIPVTAGTPPFTNWACGNCAANLPAGLSFSNGNISGTATGAGTGNINVSLSDAAGGTATAMYTITADTLTSVGFSGPYQLQNWSATASNGGTTTITPPSGPSTSGQFAYSINLGGGGVSGRTWTFQDTASASGTVSFNWQYTGFHAYFDVTALLQVFDASNVVTLYNAGPADCCSSPSGGFSVSGTATINVNQGDPFGWIVGGSNFDSNSVLNGTLTITNFSAPLSAPATFSATGSMNIARSSPTATLLQNGQVLIAGGFDGSNPLASAEIYDPNTGLFSVTGSMGAARYVHTATLLPNGQVLITGGQSSSSALAGAELYNPVTGTFSATGSMNAARENQTATLLQNGQVLIAAGNNSSGPLASAELYDPSTGLFSVTGSMGTARYVPMAALLPNGQVLIAGGITNPNPTYVGSAELYNPVTGTFSYTGSMSTARGYFTATALQNGQVLAAGGYNGFAQVTTAELYDPTMGTFSLTGSMTNQQGGPATLLSNGQVLFAGGYNGSSLATSELYNPTTGMFSLTGSMTTARNGPAATLLVDGQVLVVGGTGNSGVLASAELYAPPN